ncbi:MAG: VanZ family protein [Patescibacteria group bacterium]|nr:VanZ family protein [Patescibacteria group bacterium]
MLRNSHSLILKWLNAYLPPIVWACLIFVLSAQSSLPSLTTSPLDFILKKSAHIFVYAILFLLIHRALQKTSHQPVQTDSLWVWAFLICLLYASCDEIHQSFVLGRYATLRDVGYDMLGAGISFLYKYRYV